MSAGGMNNASIKKLRSVIDRVERIEEEIAGLNGDKSGIYDDAKAFGLDVKVVKALVAKRRKLAKDPNAFTEQQDALEMYEAALEGSFTPSRARAREEHDPETGEIRESRPASEVVAEVQKLADMGVTIEVARSPAAGPRPAFDPIAQVEAAVAAVPAAQHRQPLRTVEPRIAEPAPEMPDLPSFLDRRNEQIEAAAE